MANLGRITVDLLAKSEQFEAGLAKAANATASFGASVTKQGDEWARAFERTDDQWNKYLSLGDKAEGVGKLSKSLREMGQIVGPQLGGHFLRLAGSIDKVVAAGKQLAGLPAFSGAGADSGLGALLTRGVPIVGAAAIGWKAGSMIAGATPPGMADIDRYGRSNSIASRIGRMFAGTELSGAVGWLSEYRRELDRVNALAEKVNFQVKLRRDLEAHNAQRMKEEADSFERISKAMMDANFKLTYGGAEGRMQTILAAVSALEKATDRDTVADKLTRQIGEARKAIDEMLKWKEADPAELFRAESRLNELSAKLSEQEAADSKAAAERAASGASVADRNFLAVDSLSRLASGTARPAGPLEKQTQLLTEINNNIRDMKNRQGAVPVVVR